MNIIILSGGSGERLWPLSTNSKSKQFLKILPTKDGGRESMIQYIYNGIKNVDENAVITIATSEDQVKQIHDDLNKNVDISVEPCRRNTFPAIVLAASYLKDKKGILDDETVLVCPVDPYVDEEYFKALKNLDSISDFSKSNLYLMGINPTYPSEKFGYIIPETKDDVSKVLEFKEKPSKEVAEQYINKGALWNGGIFSFQLGYLLSKAHELIDFKDYDDLYNKYESLEKISFDYAFVEKEEKISVMRFNGKWDDLGTWSSLEQILEQDFIGKGTMSESCKNIKVFNELDIPIVCLGLDDVIVAASSEGILISKKKETEGLKKHLEKIKEK